jgi:hypothetical protein
VMEVEELKEGKNMWANSMLADLVRTILAN